MGIIFVVALLARLATIYLVVGWDGIYTADASGDDKIAYSLIEGKGFTIDGTALAYRGPFYPLFLAAIYKVFGYRHWIAQLIQIFIGSLSCLVGYLIGARLFSKAVGLLSALIMAGHPYLCLLTGYLLTETLFTLLLLLAVLWVVKFIDKPSWKQCLGAGLWLGVANLTRPIALAFPFFIFLWFWLNLRTKKDVLRMTLLIISFMSLVITPWAYRNYRVFHKFIPVYIGLGRNLWGGNNPEVFKKVDKRGTWYMPDSIRIKTNLSEIDLDRRYTKLALEFIKENPKQFLILLYFKFLKFWQWGYSSTLRNTIITFLYGILFFPFMVLGFFLSLKHSRQTWIIHLLAIYFTIVSLIFFGSDGSSGTRYRVPLEPFLSIFVAYGLISLIKKYYPESRLLKFLE
ncbi:MAG: glycosyltransferase family 39 protein [Candidatus Omnitrophota bacterium]